MVWQPWSGTAMPDLSLHGANEGDAVIANPIANIAAPPAYRPSSTTDHCRLWWQSWLPRQSAAGMPWGLSIQISAPSDAAATVTTATVHVYRSYKPKKASVIQCDHSNRLSNGIPVPATHLMLDLAHPHATPTFTTEPPPTRIRGGASAPQCHGCRQLWTDRKPRPRPERTRRGLRLVARPDGSRQRTQNDQTIRLGKHTTPDLAGRFAPCRVRLRRAHALVETIDADLLEASTV